MEEQTGWTGRLYRRAAAIVALIIMLLIGSLLAGCSSSNNDSNSSAATQGMSSEIAEYNGSAEEKLGATSSDNSAAYQDSAAPSESAEKPKSDQPTSAGSNPGISAIGSLDRKLIYNANVTMEVEDYGAAQTELFNMVALSGGYMINFSDNQTSFELGGVFVLKVPSTGFQSLLTQLKQLKKGDTFQQNVRGQDVTEEYIDLDSRLKAKQVVESRLLAFMDKAADTKDLLQFSNELARVQEDIETIKGRMRYIDQNVAFSTIELRMYEKLKKSPNESDPDEGNVFQRAGSAMKGSAQAVLNFFEGLLIVLAGSFPVLVIMALVIVPIWIAYRKTRYKRRDIAGSTFRETGEYRAVTPPEPDKQAKADGD